MKKTLIVLIILALACTAVFAQNFSDKGFTVVSRGSEDGYTRVTLRDGKGIQFDIIYKGSLTQSELDVLQEIQTVVASWNYISISKLRYVFGEDQVELQVFPSSYNYLGRNYIANLPSGLKFYYTGILEYDFRILVQQMTLRVTGPYFNEDQLADKLKSAVDDPIAYIESHDPEHIVRRLKETDNSLEEIRADISGLEENLEREADETDRDIVRLEGEAERFADRYESDKTELAEMLAEEKAQLLARIDQLSKDTDERIAQLTEDFDALIAELKSENEKLTENYRLLQLGTIAVTYQGIFSTIKDFNKEAVESAIAIKQENPSYTEEDLVTACKEQEIKLSKKEAHIIFMVYFNEF